MKKKIIHKYIQEYTFSELLDKLLWTGVKLWSCIFIGGGSSTSKISSSSTVTSFLLGTGYKEQK